MIAKATTCAFLIGGPRPGEFTIRRKNDFDVSDVALLPSGDLVLLERKFGWTTGLYIRIRRIAIAELRPGALLDGPVLLEADLGQQIDNLEGISVHRSGERSGADAHVRQQFLRLAAHDADAVLAGEAIAVTSTGLMVWRRAP